MVAQVCSTTRHSSGIIRVRASQNRTNNSKPQLPKTPPESFRTVFFKAVQDTLALVLVLVLAQLGTLFSSAVSEFGTRTKMIFPL